MTESGPIPPRALRETHERGARRVRELTELLDSIVESSESANLDDEHDPEGATVGFERAQVSALLDHARDQLAEIGAALERFDRGTYGVCERCGEEVPKARLEAQPATRRCVTCAAPRTR